MVQLDLRYSRVAMLLHWLIAACFAFQIGLGWRMDAPRGPQTFAVYQLHKSIGITILLLTLVRIGWRLSHRAPPFPPAMRRWEKGLANLVHIAFYVVLLAMPLSGWLIVSTSAVAVPTLLFGTVPWPHLPGIAGLASPAKATANAIGSKAHYLLALGALVLIGLHVLGALKHQLLDRNDEAARMLPAPRPFLSGAALTVAAALVGVIALGRMMPLRPIARSTVPVASAAATAPAPVPAVPEPAFEPPQAVAKAAAPAPVSAPAKASEWVIRPARSSVRFHTAWSQGPIDGHFASWSAKIRFDPAVLEASSVGVRIDMISAKTGVPDTEGALPGSDWFAAATHPTARYSATRFRSRGGARYEALGTLTLRGVSHPLTLPFTLTIKGDVATMAGTARIDRTLFGVGQGEWQATADLPAAVSVSVAIVADRQR